MANTVEEAEQQLTLRNYAIAALPGVIAAANRIQRRTDASGATITDRTDISPMKIAEQAWDIAYAMLSEQQNRFNPKQDGFPY